MADRQKFQLVDLSKSQSLDLNGHVKGDLGQTRQEAAHRNGAQNQFLPVMLLFHRWSTFACGAFACGAFVGAFVVPVEMWLCRPNWCGDVRPVSSELRQLWEDTVYRGTVFTVDTLASEWYSITDLANRQPEGTRKCAFAVFSSRKKKEFIHAMANFFKTRDAFYLATGHLLQMLKKQQIQRAEGTSNLKLQNEWETHYFDIGSQIDIAYVHDKSTVYYGMAEIVGRHMKQPFNQPGMAVNRERWPRELLVHISLGPAFSKSCGIGPEALRQTLQTWFPNVICELVESFNIGGTIPTPLTFPDRLNLRSYVARYWNSGDEGFLYTSGAANENGLCVFERATRQRPWAPAKAYSVNLKKMQSKFRILYQSATQWYYDVRRIMRLLTFTVPSGDGTSGNGTSGNMVQHPAIPASAASSSSSASSVAPDSAVDSIRNPTSWTDKVEMPTDWDAPDGWNALFDLGTTQIILAYCWGDRLCPTITDRKRWINHYGGKVERERAKRIQTLEREEQLLHQTVCISFFFSVWST